MNIETKFNVGDIVKHKYESNPERVMGFEVMEIKSNTCYAGTQNFYYCRSLLANKIFKNIYDDFDWSVGFGISNDPNMPTAWQQMREDELIFVSDEDRLILTGATAIAKAAGEQPDQFREIQEPSEFSDGLDETDPYP